MKSASGWLSPGPGLMSLTRPVPAAVPSLPHSSDPCVLCARKSTRLPTAVMFSIDCTRWPGPGAGIVPTMEVPELVPSVRHSAGKPVLSSEPAR